MKIEKIQNETKKKDLSRQSTYYIEGIGPSIKSSCIVPIIECENLLKMKRKKIMENKRSMCLCVYVYFYESFC